ncbi:MAG TPA: PASTA domain-containing protein [Coriobacteriia bacterium]
MAANTPAAPGPTVPTGSHVVVVVSRGPAPGPRQGAASVPALLGTPQGEALEHLQQVGLNAQVFNDFNDVVKRGYIVDQFPVAGANAAVNSEVVVLVSSGPAEKTTLAPLPDVVGLQEAEAASRLRAAGLEPEVARDYHPNVEEGVVLAQLPSQATISAGKRHGSLAWLWIAIAVLLVLAAAGAAYFILAGKQVSVPDVTGQTQAQAEQVLRAAGLKTGNVSSRTGSNVAAGIVVEQVPQAGVEVNTGSAVNLVVAEAKPEAQVPNLVGLNSSDANAAITAAGLVAQVSNVYSDTVPKDAVVSQSPAAGSTVAKGSTVNFSVSLGSKVTNVTLPDFVGMTQNAAVNRAVALGLRARISSEYNSTAPAGQVVDQIPDAGQSVAPGTTVGISVSLGTAPPTSVTIPDLKGQTAANAQNALSALGLVAATVDWDGTGQPADTVVGQSPKAGEQVAPGSSVVVFVSSGK